MPGVLRTCIGCAKEDDHPRHVHTLADGSSVNLHMDCCVISRNCDICKGQLAAAAGVKGDDLRAHLLTTGPAADQPGWTAPVAQEG